MCNLSFSYLIVKLFFNSASNIQLKLAAYIERNFGKPQFK